MQTLLETEVRPGDVISSSLFQSMIAKIAEMDARIASLEGLSGGDTGTPLIQGFIPVNQQRVNRELELTGVNFVVPANANTVAVDGVEATEFLAGSTTTALQFIIPSGVTVGTNGEAVEIRVTNANGSHAVLYFVLPPLAPTTPPPVIDAVVNDNGSNPPLEVGEFFRIQGQNFAGLPGDNRITFRVTTQTGTTTYPRAGEQIEIDAANSDAQEIRVRMPDFIEAPTIPIPISVTLELQVGAHPPVTQQIQVVRLP